MFSIQIQQSVFSLAEQQSKLTTHESDDGALVVFQGMVRGKDHSRTLSHLYIEHYPEVTEQEIERIVELAKMRWSINSCIIIHRVGNLQAGEPIVLVMVSSAHRKDAFCAAEFIMDYLKTEAPFWKKEYFNDGSEQWVAVKITDHQQKKRWA